MLSTAFVALTAATGAQAANMVFPSMSKGAPGRNLLEMSFEELAFPQGQIQHEVATSDQATVDGKEYDIECVPLHSAMYLMLCTSSGSCHVFAYTVGFHQIWYSRTTQESQVC